MGWITNDPDAARRLKAIDEAYAKARRDAMNLPLARKVEAFAEAKRVRKEAEQAFFAEIRAKDSPKGWS